MSTLVLCVDRTDDIGRKAGVTGPVRGWDAVTALVTDVGLADPEDSSVNALLEALHVTRQLREEDGEEAEIAVVSGSGESVVGADRAVARQMDELIEAYDPDSAVVVIDSSQDERLVPIIESRVPVDAVDRVVVRQARDLESTYYLLKQFLADEELRQAVLVPTGVALLVFPLILALEGPAVAVAVLTAVLGVFLLYKGFSVDDYVADLPSQVQEALYSGQVSVVTYVVAGGLALIGVFAGALGVTGVGSDEGLLIPAMMFTYASVPWLAMSALAASTGRLLDEIIREDRIRRSYLNLPFGVIAVGLVIRGFSGFFLELDALIEPMAVPAIKVGNPDPIINTASFALTPGQRLALFVVSGVLVSIIGVRVTTMVDGSAIEEPEVAE